jgi:hypothetical protein
VVAGSFAGGPVLVPGGPATPAPELDLVGVSCGFGLVVCAIATAGSIAITSATTSFGIAISIHTLLIAETTQHCHEGLTVRPLCSFQLEPKFWNYTWSVSKDRFIVRYPTELVRRSCAIKRHLMRLRLALRGLIIITFKVLAAMLDGVEVRDPK